MQRGLNFGLNSCGCQRRKPHTEVSMAAKRGRPRKSDQPSSSDTGAKDLNKRKDELQDLLIDPAYDPLFDGINEDAATSTPSQDPFLANREAGAGNLQGKKRIGRPMGTPRTSFAARTDTPDYASRRTNSWEPEPSKSDSYNLLFEDGSAEDSDEEETHKTIFDYHLKLMRQTYLQEQQAEVMSLHHKQRATEVSPFAQATALASLMEYYDRQDELGLDTDPLPAWIRAKRTIAHNWHVMEQLAGNRKETIKNLQDFSNLTPERQQLLDTWDESLYEGEKDTEERAPDFMDKYLLLSDSMQTAEYGQEQPTAEDWSKGIMPDEDPEGMEDLN